MEYDYIECGDCVKLMKKLPDECVDMVLTSPPYDNLRGYNGFEWDFEDTAKEIYRVVKKGGVVVWVVGDSTVNGTESLTSFKQALFFKNIGFNVHDTMIYQKVNYIPLTHNRYEQSFEYMFVFSKGKPKTFNPIMIPCKNAGKIESYGNKRRSVLDEKQAMRAPEGIIYKKTKNEKIHPNIFSYSCGGSRTGHPAVFPNNLAKDMILSWSNPGDIILDPMIGSGTTAEMAVITGRHYIGFELSDAYFDIASERLDKVEVV